jgi:hypothetical protein
VSVLRLAEVRDRRPDLAATVSASHARAGVSRSVLIAACELRALEETVAVLADPALTESLTAAQRQVLAGQVAEQAELADAMGRRADRDPVR